MAPALSRGGRWIYYSKGRISFWKIPWNGGTPVLLRKPGPKWTRAYTMRGSTFIAWERSRRGRPASRSCVGRRDGNCRHGTGDLRNWALGEGASISWRAPRHPRFGFLDLTTYRVSRLAKLPGRPYVKRRGLAVSPDGTRCCMLRWIPKSEIYADRRHSTRPPDRPAGFALAARSLVRDAGIHLKRMELFCRIPFLETSAMWAFGEKCKHFVAFSQCGHCLARSHSC
jgi:hypothetical protein